MYTKISIFFVLYDRSMKTSLRLLLCLFPLFHFFDGLAQSYPEVVIHENGYQMGFSKEGEMISDFSYDFINLEAWYPYGMIVQKNGRFGVVDTNIHEQIPCKFDEIGRFRNIPDRLYIRKGGKVKIVDFQLREVCPFFQIDFDEDFEFEDFPKAPKEMAYRIRKGNLFGYVNTNGKFIIPPRHKWLDVIRISGTTSSAKTEALDYKTILDLTTSNSEKETYHLFQVSGEMGFSLFNQSGENIKEAFVFDQFYGAFNIEWLATRLDGRTQFLNLKTGELADSISHSSPQIVSDGHLFGLLAANGEFVLPFEYSSIRSHSEPHPFYQLEKNRKKGLADSDGKMILKMEFDRIKFLCGWGQSDIPPIAVYKRYQGWAIYVWSKTDQCFIPRTGHVYSSLSCSNSEAKEIKFVRNDHKSGIIHEDWLIRWDYKTPGNRVQSK